MTKESKGKKGRDDLGDIGIYISTEANLGTRSRTS